MPSLTFQTTFAPEIDLSSVLLTSNKIWLPGLASTPHAELVPHPRDASMMPKPPGQVTEINKGGYSLEEFLRWPDGQYTEVQKFIRSRAEVHLNTRESFCKQKPGHTSKVYEEVTERFSFMRQYKDDWVTKDYLRMYLKNSSRTARLHRTV